jgi:pimeloyl-ACP methyl ester carboxylesterase
MPEITLPHGTLHYREAGPADGPPVVFVHGFLVDGTLWSAVADDLASRGMRALAPDWPLGAHRHPLAPGADRSPRGLASMIAAFLAALELERVTLVGNDTGGALCQFLLDTDASRVGALVLTNCDAFDVFPPRPFDLLFKVARRPGLARALMLPARLAWLRHSLLAFGPLVKRPLDPVQTRGWIEPYLTNAAIRRDVQAFCRAVDPRELLDVSTRLDRFDGPVKLCWAPEDRFFRIELAQRLLERFRVARLVEVPDSRTFVPHDQPARLADEILELAGVGVA